MKKMMILAVMMVMTISANAMSYNAAKNEALFLSDKMAYELNLTAAQYEAVYEINLDYLLSINGHNDTFGIWWDRRNADLRFVLNAWQYDRYMSRTYFYRPVTWKTGGWSFGIYTHYDRNRYYNAHPTVFVTYKGGNNHRGDRFYADRHVTKPTVHNNHNSTRHTANTGTWHNTNRTTTPTHNSTTVRTTTTTHNNATVRTSTTDRSHRNGNTSGSGHFGRK